MLISGTKSRWRPETIIVPWGSVLGSVLFNTLINGLDFGTVCSLSSFADDTKLEGVVGTPEGPGATQGLPGRLEQWAGRSLMQFHKEKCGKCCTWIGTAPGSRRAPWLEGVSAEQSVLVGTKVNKKGTVAPWAALGGVSPGG